MLRVRSLGSVLALAGLLTGCPPDFSGVGAGVDGGAIPGDGAIADSGTVPDGGAVADTGAPLDASPGTDVPQGVDEPPGVDVPGMTQDSGMGPVDVPPPPMDVPVTMPDVPPPPMDTGPSPSDVPTVMDTGGPVACGARGQVCCAGGTCNTDLGCLAWGSTQVCGPCGGPGQSCCPGRTCTDPGARCVSLLGGSLETCQVPSAHPNEPGGTCEILRAGSSCGPADTACIRNGLTAAACVACGTLGQPCCYGLTCDAGNRHCSGTAAGIYVCR